MPFVEVDIKSEIDERKKESESFAKAWNESREEYKLIGEMIRMDHPFSENFLQHAQCPGIRITDS